MSGAFPAPERRDQARTNISRDGQARSTSKSPRGADRRIAKRIIATRPGAGERRRWADRCDGPSCSAWRRSRQAPHPRSSRGAGRRAVRSCPTAPTVRRHGRRRPPPAAAPHSRPAPTAPASPAAPRPVSLERDSSMGHSAPPKSAHCSRSGSRSKSSTDDGESASGTPRAVGSTVGCAGGAVPKGGSGIPPGGAGGPRRRRHPVKRPSPPINQPDPGCRMVRRWLGRRHRLAGVSRLPDTGSCRDSDRNRAGQRIFDKAERIFPLAVGPIELLGSGRFGLFFCSRAGCSEHRIVGFRLARGAPPALRLLDTPESSRPARD